MRVRRLRSRPNHCPVLIDNSWYSSIFNIPWYLLELTIPGLYCWSWISSTVNRVGSHLNHLGVTFPLSLNFLGSILGFWGMGDGIEMRGCSESCALVGLIGNPNHFWVGRVGKMFIFWSALFCLYFWVAIWGCAASCLNEYNAALLPATGFYLCYISGLNVFSRGGVFHIQLC